MGGNGFCGLGKLSLGGSFVMEVEGERGGLVKVVAVVKVVMLRYPPAASAVGIGARRGKTIPAEQGDHDHV